MTRLRAFGVAGSVTALVAMAISLHDPPWAGSLTSGLRPPEIAFDGTPFRWTTGRGSFFVPSDATAVTLRFRTLRPVSPLPVTVDVHVDDRRLATITLPDPLRPDSSLWVTSTLPLPRRTTSRRFRRVDLRVRRWLPRFHLGVQLGQIEVERR